MLDLVDDILLDQRQQNHICVILVIHLIFWLPIESIYTKISTQMDRKMGTYISFVEDIWKH